MNKKVTTIKDIAKALEIAPSTVSKALRESSDISQEMMERVKKAALKMHYSPNYMAQRLRDRRTKNIAVIVPTIQDDLYSSIIDGMEDIIFRKGYNLIVHKTGESYHREQLLIQSLSSHVDGIMLSLSTETKKFDHLKQLKQKNIPLILFERYTNKINCSKVVFNDEKLSYAITEQLIKSGCQTIAYICGPLDLTTFESRIRGYKQALLKYSISIDESLIIPTKLSKQEGKQAFHAIMHLDKQLDAIITDNSALLLSVHDEIRKIFPGYGTLHLASLDYNEMYGFLQPAVTCVSQKGYEMGSLAAQTCIQEIEANEKIKPVLNTVSSQLIVRTQNPTENQSEGAKFQVNDHSSVGQEIIYVY